MPERVALTLSGHTHGGQVRLFGWSPIVPSRYGNRYAYGHVAERQRDLIVSAGLGTSVQPLRLGVPPECYDDITTSGDAAQTAMIEGAVGRKVWHIGAKEHSSFFTEMAKDTAAGAVLAVSFAAAVAGAIIFLPKLWPMLR